MRIPGCQSQPLSICGLLAFLSCLLWHSSPNKSVSRALPTSLGLTCIWVPESEPPSRQLDPQPCLATSPPPLPTPALQEGKVLTQLRILQRQPRWLWRSVGSSSLSSARSLTPTCCLCAGPRPCFRVPAPMAACIPRTDPGLQVPRGHSEHLGAHRGCDRREGGRMIPAL